MGDEGRACHRLGIQLIAISTPWRTGESHIDQDSGGYVVTIRVHRDGNQLDWASPTIQSEIEAYTGSPGLA
jgi:hypothetical protein